MSARNVVLLMTDQQRFDMIGALGNTPVRTPNLDRLAARGVHFTHATTPHPLCGPARHAMFTGVGLSAEEPQLNKACWRPDGRFIPEILAAAGYRTGGFGKFHFFPVRAHHGFQHYAMNEELDPGSYREDSDYLVYLKEKGLGHIPYTSGVRGPLYFQPQRSLIPEEHHETKWVADRALEFLHSFHRSPFFLFASWLQPHFPVNVPDRFADLYRTDDMPDPPFSESETLPWICAMQKNASDLLDPATGLLDRVRMRRVKALYYASITFIDEQIGRVLDELERKGLLDDTLIIFTSDHGELLGDHQSFTKMCGYEGSVRVPLILAGPGITGGGRSSELASLYDLAPTIYEFTGVPPPPANRMLGSSLFGDRETVRAREEVFFDLGTGRDCFVGIRTRRWKYNYYAANGLRQLFDLENDPDELRNLCLENADGPSREVAACLHRRLLEWNQEYGFPGRLDGDDFAVIRRDPPGMEKNAQYDYWIDNLPENEKAQLWSEARCVYEAVKNERGFDPFARDLDFWEAARGPGAINELEDLLRKDGQRR